MVTNPILVAQVVTTAFPARTLGVSLSTSSFNVGIAGGSWLGGLALASNWGIQGASGVMLVLLS